MNLVQDKVKQRNITPNFLRFRSISHLIKERALPIRSGKKEKTIRSKLRSPLNVLKGALQKLAAAVFRHTNVESYT